MLALKKVRFAAATSLAIVFGALVACSESPAPKTAAAASPESQAVSAADIAGAPAPTAATAPAQPRDDLRTASDADAAVDDAENRIRRLLGTGVKTQALSTDGCETACQALASMRRATDRLCDLTNDQPARCADARGRLDRATQRVHDVCSECASG